MRDPTLIARARWMRANPTPSELRLWRVLRAHRFEHFKFRRQVVIHRYIADFACRTPQMVIIEVDGDTHDYTGQYDERRTACLEGLGYRVIRFTNEEVAKHLDGVLVVLRQRLLLDSPSPGLASLDHPLP